MLISAKLKPATVGMKKVSVLLFALVLAVAASAEESWLGLYLQGNKIGYSRYTEAPGEVDGKPGKVATSLTVVKSQMLGAGLDMTVSTQSWLSGSGELKRLVYDMQSAGRTLKVEASFGSKEIKASMDASGRVSQHVVPIPDGAKIVDDPTATLLAGGFGPGVKSATFYQFDPTSLSLIKTSVRHSGREKIEIDGKPVDAERIQVEDPRAPMTMYVSAKGDLMKATGPFGMEMYPEIEAVAKDFSTKRGNAKGRDIAEASRIVPDGTIANPFSREKLTLVVTGNDLANLPRGAHQTVETVRGELRLTIHPVRNPNAATTIAQAASEQPDWIKPDVRVPSDSTTFRDLAKKLIGDETKVVAAAERVRKFVLATVGVNAGIGVMRDADEILETKEGVCRDHAILMAAILKAAGIPTKLVAGLVYFDGGFYYHAWVEVWDGDRWYGIDSTRQDRFLTATHIKTAEGKVAEAYVGFLLDNAKFRVVEDRK